VTTEAIFFDAGNTLLRMNYAAIAGVLARQLRVRRVALSARCANQSSEGAGEGSRAEGQASL